MKEYNETEQYEAMLEKYDAMLMEEYQSIYDDEYCYDTHYDPDDEYPSDY